MTHKLPAIQFYPGDWYKEVGLQALDLWHRGLWFEILLRMHESSERGVLLLGGKPMTDEALARSLGEITEKITEGITQLITYGVAERDNRGAVICRRMIRDEEQRRVNTTNGMRGGNPNFAKGQKNPYYDDNRKDNPPHNRKDNRKITPSSSSSSSSSSSDINKEIVYPNRLDNPTCRDSITAWTQYRKEARKPVTQSGLQAILKKYSENPIGLVSDIQNSIAQGYQGIFPPSVKNGAGPHKLNTFEKNKDLIQSIIKEKTI